MNYIGIQSSSTLPVSLSIKNYSNFHENINNWFLIDSKSRSSSHVKQPKLKLKLRFLTVDLIWVKLPTCHRSQNWQLSLYQFKLEAFLTRNGIYLPIQKQIPAYYAMRTNELEHIPSFFLCHQCNRKFKYNRYQIQSVTEAKRFHRIPHSGLSVSSTSYSIFDRDWTLETSAS